MKITTFISVAFFALNALNANLTDYRGYYFFTGFFAASTVMCCTALFLNRKVNK